MRESDLLNLAVCIHDSVFAEDGWAGFARAIEGAVPGSAASLVVPLREELSVLEAIELDRVEEPDVVEWHAPSTPAEFVAPFLERFRFEEHNPFLVPQVPRAGRGGVCRSDELAPLEELRRSAMFNEWMRPQGLAAGPGLVAYLREDQRDLPLLHLFCKQGRRPFGAGYERALRVLLPHIRQAVRARAHLYDVDRERRALADVLERVAVGIVLLDRRGRVYQANATARAVLERRDGLEVSRGEFRASSAGKAGALQRLVAEATRAGAGEGLGAGGVLGLPRSRGRDLVVLVTPLRVSGSGHTERAPVAAVFLMDSELDRALAVEVLGAVYDLTPREAELACELAHGRTLAEAAAKLGTKLSTERSRLREVFLKTGTERQAELVRFVLTKIGQVIR